jgi:adenylate kinase
MDFPRQRNKLEIYLHVILNRGIFNKCFINECFSFLKIAEESVEEEEAQEVETEEAGKAPKFSKLVTPDIIIKLDANDEFLKNRIMNLPEKLVEGTHNSEEGLNRRLAECRSLNNEDETVSNVFEEEYELDVVKIGPEIVENDTSLLHKNIVNMIKQKYMKEPRNYGLSQEEKEVLRKVELEEKRLRDRAQREERERRAAEETLEKARKQKEWTDKLEYIKREEIEYAETQSLPLRNYLMTYVMPTLTKGLIECSKVRPEDPIDFVSEYFLNCAKTIKDE